jgi:hypothetical protein
MIRLDRTATLAAVAAALVGAAGCGGEDRPAYCDDRASLEQSIKALGDVNLTRQGGIADLQESLRQVEADARKLADSARDEFGPQASALRSSVSGLGTAVDRAASEPSRETLTAVADDVSQVGTAFDDVSAAVADNC